VRCGVLTDLPSCKDYKPVCKKTIGLNNFGAAGFTTDLHNFAFLGKNPYLGGASDWVWFNVPHGPQKQIDSFVSALLACKAGKETVRSTTPLVLSTELFAQVDRRAIAC